MEEYANTKITISAPSATRWTYRSRALRQLKENANIFINFFECVHGDMIKWDTNTRNLAGGYARTLVDRDFKFLLVCLEKIFSLCHRLFQQLEKVQQTIIAANRRFDSVIETLGEWRCNETFEEICAQAADSVGPVDAEPRKKRTNFGDDDRRVLYFSIVDSVIGHLQTRMKCLPELHFLSLLETSSFDKYSREFPSTSLRALCASPYASLFDEVELQDELKDMYSDKLLTEGFISLSDLLSRIHTQGIEDACRQLTSFFT